MDEAMSLPGRSPSVVLDVLEADFGQELNSNLGSLREHLSIALEQFHQYVSPRDLPEAVDMQLMELIIALHDMGKPKAMAEGYIDKHQQYSSDIAGSVLSQLGYTKDQAKIATALIKDDPLGKFLNPEISTDDITAAGMIINGAHEAGISLEDYWKLKQLYYKIDASSYTVNAGGGNWSPLNEIFLFDPDKKSIEFSPLALNRIQELEKVLFTNKGKVAVEASMLADITNERITLEPHNLEFIDGRGEVRRVNPMSAEVFLTDEVKAAVDKHFANFYKQLTEIDELLQQLGSGISNEEMQSGFNPLDNAFVDSLKTKLAAQMKQVADYIPGSEAGWWQKRSRFKRQVPRTNLNLTDGYTLDFTDRERQAIARIAELPSQQTKQVLQALAEQLLLDDSRPSLDALAQVKAEDRHKRRQPLLSTRMIETGLSPDELDAQKLVQLVPELKPLQEAVDKIRKDHKKALLFELGEPIKQELFGLRPDKNLISAIFYSDKDIEQLIGRYRLLYEKVEPDENTPGWFEPGFVQDQISDIIKNFFNDKALADTLIFHGTPFLPRIISHGAAYPPEKMHQLGIEFTYNTMRNAAGGRKELRDGSMAMHWTGQHGSSYTQDGQRVADDNVERDNERKHYEIQKGGIAGGAVAIRLGDAIKHAPYIGYGLVGDSEARHRRLLNNHNEASIRSTVVTLTKDGKNKVAASLRDRYPSSDIVFLAAPRDDTDEKVFDYSFPLDELFIEIGSSQQETVLNALKQAGWTDQQIAQRTITFTDQEFRKGITDEEISRRALNSLKYPNGVIVGLSQETAQ